MAEEPQRLLGEGSEDWNSLNFIKKPELPQGVWEEYELNLSDEFRLFDVSTKEEARRFHENYRGAIEKMPISAKKYFILSAFETLYFRNQYAVANAFLDCFDLDENQKDGVLFWTAIRAMEPFYDPYNESIMITKPHIAKRIAESHPSFWERQGFKTAAESGFLAEIEQINITTDRSLGKEYLDLGLVSKEILTDERFIKSRNNTILRLLKWGYGKVAVDVLKVYPASHEFLNSEDVYDSATEGFWEMMEISPEESKLIASNFLPPDFLKNEEISEKIKNIYLLGLNEGILNSLEISKNFGELLPNTIIGPQIWKTQEAYRIKDGLLVLLKNGWSGIEGVKTRFGIPKNILEDEKLKRTAISTLQDSIRWSDRERANNIISSLELEPETWREVITTEFLEKMYEEGYFDRFTEFASGGPNIEIDPENLEKFIEKIINGYEQLNSDTLEKLARLREAIPGTAKYLNLLAGPNYPQGATVNDLIDLTQSSTLLTNAIENLYMFTISEVDEVVQQLNEKKFLNSIPFFNILKRSGILKTITEGEKDRLLFWVRKWGQQAKLESQRSNSEANKRLVRGHWARYPRLSKETGGEVVGRLYRHKAPILAEAIEMFGDTKNIDAIGELLDRTDPNKLYQAGHKDIRKLLVKNFSQIN